MKYFPHIIIIFLFTLGCSFQAPERQWQIRSKSAFNSYTTNFLSGHSVMATNDLNRAIKHINVTADLNKLAKLYLSVCALNIAVGINDQCNDYLELQDLVNNKKLFSYYNLLQNKLDTKDIINLPLHYQAYAKNVINHEYIKAFKALELMNKPNSRFVAAGIIKNKLTSSQRDKLIQDASFYGYKKIVIFWLEQSLKLSDDFNEKKHLMKKIKILKNN